MSSKRRVVSIALVGLMLTMLFTACSSGNGNATIPAEQTEQTAANKPDESLEPVTLKMWLTPMWKGVLSPDESGADYDSFFKAVGEKFKEDNPNVSLEVQVIAGEQRPDKLNVCIQTNTLPDMFFDGSFTMIDFIQRGVIIPIEDIIDETSKNDISQGIWDNVSFNGKIYVYPFTHMPGTLCYNAELFKKAGLDQYIGEKYDIITWSIDDYKYILETIKEKLPDVYPTVLFCKNFAGDTWNLAYMRMFGCKFFDESGHLIANNEEGVKALTFLTELKNSGLTAPGPESLTSNDALVMFANQKVAVSITNSVLFNNTLDDMKSGKTPTFDARLANIPGVDNPNSFTYVTGGMAFDTGDEAKMALSKQFIKYFSTDPYFVLASQNGLPVRTSVLPQVKEKLPYLKAQNENAKYLFNFSNGAPGYTQLRNILFPALQSAFMGTQTPKEALDEYVKKGNEIIDKSKKELPIFN